MNASRFIDGFLRILAWLVFLYVGVVVLGTLTGAFSGGHGVIEATQKALAKNDATQIATALTAYQTEYGRLPEWTNRTVSGDLILILTGSNAARSNPRQIVFLEARPAKRAISGVTNGAFVDPWGAPYLVALDLDGDGKVVGGTNQVELLQSAAVWNDPRLGTYKMRTKPEQLQRRYVTSWDEPRRPNYPQSQKPSASPAQNP